MIDILAEFGQQYSPSIRAEIPLLVAQDMANALVGLYDTARPIVTFDLPGADATVRTQQFGREISDRITVVDAQTSLNNDFFIEQIAHRMDDDGFLTTTFGCEKVPATNYFVLGLSKLDVDAIGF